MSSSLKERIKVNKVLTFSPKTGNLIGINPNRKKSAVMDLFTQDQINEPMFGGHRNVFGKNVDLPLEGHHPRPVKAGLKNKLGNLGGLPNNGVYTSNTAYNLTYKTISLPKNVEKTLMPKSPHKSAKNL